MDHARSNSHQENGSTAAVLIRLVRLLARQAAREWTERQPENDEAAPPHPCWEKRS
jgi:hypothetical protein